MKEDGQYFDYLSSIDNSTSLKLLSYNIQVGVYTCRPSHYITHSWKHVLPDPARSNNLDKIAKLISQYDIVGLQEVDGGSMRSGFIEQTGYLANQAGFPYWCQQVNRKLGRIARHSNGFISRFKPTRIVKHKLPGLPGRGAIFAYYGEEILVCVLHLALGKRARLRQLSYICERVNQVPHVIVMGDLNCKPDSFELNWLLKNTHLKEPTPDLYTFPSWHPNRNIDHILISNSFKINHVGVVDYPGSDHLPIEMEISLPEAIKMAA